MKLFFVLLLVVSSANAYPRKFLYEGKTYISTFDIDSDRYPQCRHQITTWRKNRSQELKYNAHNHISSYLTATPCDIDVAKGLVADLKDLFPGTDYSSVEYANFLLAYVNSYYYKSDESWEYSNDDPSFKNIFDTFDRSGDCEDLALLLTSLLSYSCLDTAFLIWKDHATSSVCVNTTGKFYQINDKKYYYADATGCGGTKCLPNVVGEKTSTMTGIVLNFDLVSRRNCE